MSSSASYKCGDPTGWSVGADFALEGCQMRAYTKGKLSHLGAVHADGSIDWECCHDKET